MAATTDRARFYLEQYVPELQEYEQKGVFSRDEISAITAKRSDFEHILSARGSSPADYARYATYEMNLDTLRKKRCKRLGVKGVKAFNGQRTVFFVLDRATKKFPGDMGLWMQYIDFCKKEKANKKLARVFTSVLRLHPRDWQLWVLAAKYYAEMQGDMSTARSYLQRGLRFCKDELRLYLEYAKLEMVYLAKLAARRKLLGLDEEKQEKADEDENMISLPTITAEDLDPDAGKGIEEVNEDALKRLENAPAFTGAIPIAIFDAAIARVSTGDVADAFFDLAMAFDNVSATPRILQHILDHLHNKSPDSAEDVICQAKHEFFGIDPQSAAFPAALGKALAHIKRSRDEVTEKQRPMLDEKAVQMLLPYYTNPDTTRVVVDDDVARVLELSIKRFLQAWEKANTKPSWKSGPETMLKKMRKDNPDDPAIRVVERLLQPAGSG